MDEGSPQRDARRHHRYPINIAAAVIVSRREHPAYIKDISCLGCCIALVDLPERGEEITVVVRGLSLVATVVWSRDGLIGANFHREVDPLQVVRARKGQQLSARRRANGMIGMSG